MALLQRLYHLIPFCSPSPSPDLATQYAAELLGQGFAKPIPPNDPRVVLLRERLSSPVVAQAIGLLGRQANARAARASSVGDSLNDTRELAYLGGYQAALNDLFRLAAPAPNRAITPDQMTGSEWAYSPESSGV